MALVGLLTGYCLIVLMDLKRLLRSKYKNRTLILYAFLISVGFLISVLQIYGNNPVSPSVYIEKVVNFVINGVNL